MSEMTDKEDNEIYPQAKARDKKRNEIFGAWWRVVFTRWNLEMIPFWNFDKEFRSLKKPLFKKSL